MINKYEERRTNRAGKPSTKRVALGVRIVSNSDLQVMQFVIYFWCFKKKKK